ncbi:MAG: 2,3-bisphosphoglycerate-independent phosphoglycerate mutase [Eubacteriales bacterium]|nr:2,3-bisphosphoglycerate-independent phosphoglycerate mutase [Eubacteriales bacterium]
MDKRMLALIILDGYGISEKTEGNAIKAALKPNLDRLFSENPNTVIRTSGLDVGLPNGQMGNSEVGHTNIGAGRIVYQELTRISKSISDGDFFQKQELLEAAENCRRNDSSLHIMGLLSDGGVHSHNTHLYALLEFAKKEKIKNVYVHCFFDGRDVPPDSALQFTKELEDKLKEIGTGKIATIMGRYFAMDRDNRWERVKLAYDAMVMGRGSYGSASAVSGVEESYARKEYDEFIKPTVITRDGKPTAVIKNNDSVIFFNFRPDRAREITRSFVDRSFEGFERDNGFFPLFYVCMTQYDITIKNVHVVFKPENLNNTFGEYLSRNGKTQLRIAETEKYAHVTFFFNGGVEKVYENEERSMIPSPKVPTYDLQPEMSAYKVAQEAVERIKSGKYDVMILNFANADMVGHTGDFEAAKSAIQAVDKCVGIVTDAIRKTGGVFIITSDHGNAEQMLNEDNSGAFTAHTTNPVPFLVSGLGKVKLREGRLADIAPTMLEIMGLEKPGEMTGESLIIR